MSQLEQQKPQCAVVESLYLMLAGELDEAGYNERERAMFVDPVNYYGRFLDPKTRHYAMSNAISNLSAAVAYLGSAAECSRLIDAGCGLGMQSILFASLGWSVIGADISQECVELCRKRKTYFEARLGRKLDIEFVVADFRRASPELFGGQFDALFSMSAFAHFSPLQVAAARTAEVLRETSRMVLWDQNPGFLFGGKSPVPLPATIGTELARYGFKTDFVRGGCAVPRQLWNSWIPNGAVSRVNELLKNRLSLSFTYLYGASREKALQRTA